MKYCKQPLKILKPLLLVVRAKKTLNLCRINMFLHDIGYDKFSIEHGDTLTDPKHWDEEPFEAIVSNPPLLILINQ